MMLAFHGVIGCHEIDIDWYYDNRSHIHLTRRFVRDVHPWLFSECVCPFKCWGPIAAWWAFDLVERWRWSSWNHMKSYEITAHVTTNHVKCTKLRFSGLVHHHRQVVLPWRGRCATATLRKHRVALGQDAWQIWTASQGIAAYPSPDSIVPVESLDPEMEVLYRIKPYISGAYPLT